MTSKHLPKNKKQASLKIQFIDFFG